MVNCQLNVQFWKNVRLTINNTIQCCDHFIVTLQLHNWIEFWCDMIYIPFYFNQKQHKLWVFLCEKESLKKLKKCMVLYVQKTYFFGKKKQWFLNVKICFRHYTHKRIKFADVFCVKFADGLFIKFACVLCLVFKILLLKPFYFNLVYTIMQKTWKNMLGVIENTHTQIISIQSWKTSKKKVGQKSWFFV